MHYTSVLNVYPVNDWDFTSQLSHSFTGYICKQMTEIIVSSFNHQALLDMHKFT